MFITSLILNEHLRLQYHFLKDGRIERAGWAAIKFDERGPFLKKRYFSNWSNYSHFLIKVGLFFKLNFFELFEFF